jgi:hypothetical protein
MRQEVMLADANRALEAAIDISDTGTSFVGDAAAFDGSQLLHWRDVMWRGFVALAATPHDDDLERRVKACSTAFRAALPTLIKEAEEFDSPEAMKEAEKMRREIREMLETAAPMPNGVQ